MTSLRPMTASEYAAWSERQVPAYAADKVASGQWTKAEALEKSRQEHAELLPRGLDTPDNRFFTIVDERQSPVGNLWFAIKARFGSRVAYVFDVGIAPARRREGHAYRAFVALEAEVRESGLSGIALHVFGNNTGARALYSKLGFQPTNISLFKAVPGENGPRGTEP